MCWCYRCHGIGNRIYEDAQRELRAKEAEVAGHRATALQCETQVASTHRDYVKAKAELDVLENKESVRSLRGLQDARKAAADAAERSRQSGSVAIQARESEAQANQSLEEKRTHTVHSRTDFEARLEEAHQHAVAAGLASEHAARWSPPSPPEWTDAEKKSRHTQFEKALGARAAAFAAVALKIAARDQAQSAVAEAVQRCADLEGRAALANEALADMRDKLRSQAAEALAALRTWAAGLSELSFTALDEQEEALERWCDQAQGEAPWSAAVREAERAAINRVAAARAELKTRHDDLVAQRTTLVDEESLLHDGRHQPPPIPYVRDSTRDGRSGAPFWRVVDFHDSVSSADQAGIEAALEASGLLDGWLTPEGNALEVGLHDTWLHTATLSPLPPERSLARWLKPVTSDEDHFPRSQTVARVLSVIATDAQANSFAHVGCDGRWRLGPLAGAWEKTRAEHIGELRREAARLHRLEEIARELVTLVRDEANLNQEAAALDLREQAIRAEVLAVPSDQSMRDLGGRLLAQCAAAAATWGSVSMRAFSPPEPVP